MPGASIHYDIRAATAKLIQNQIGSLPGLTANSIKVRMMPKVGEVVDPLPCVIVAPVERIPWEPMGFEGSINVPYGVEFAIVAASNQDYLANQETYEGWLEAIRGIVLGDFIFLFTNAGVPSIWNAMIDSSVTFNRAGLARNYAYQSIYAVYSSKEVYNNTVMPFPAPVVSAPINGGMH